MKDKLWGGRFKGDNMDREVLAFTSSLDADKILLSYDCLSSKVHAEMLERCGYLDKEEARDIITALDELIDANAQGKLRFSGHEDVHSFVQSYVESKTEAGLKLHTGMSRNEQVVNDVRLYCLDAIKDLSALVNDLQKSILSLAEKYSKVIIPGYTHLNHAQPVLLAHLLIAYIEMLERDKKRIESAKESCDVSVMGSGAIAGSSLGLDRDFVAEKLGFSAVSRNSIDVVSDRDFMIELVSALSMMAVHFSRFSEDLILFSTYEFGFIDIGEKYCTGSSLMPQKKNADVLELIRGQSARITGDLNSLFILLKGLPHAYNRDLQEDKRYLFDAVELTASQLRILEGLFGSISVIEEKINAQMADEFMYATDIAEYLTGKGLPFKQAHAVVGTLVRYCIEEKKKFSDLAVKEIKVFCELFDEGFHSVINAEGSIERKKTYGSTNPDMVKIQIDAWKKSLGTKK